MDAEEPIAGAAAAPQKKKRFIVEPQVLNAALELDQGPPSGACFIFDRCSLLPRLLVGSFPPVHGSGARHGRTRDVLFRQRVRGRERAATYTASRRLGEYRPAIAASCPICWGSGK